MMDTAITVGRRMGRILVALAFLAGCSEEVAIPATSDASPDAVDQCGNRCTSDQLCVADSEGQYSCALICYNQLHCWSGCCVPLDGSPYNVCRPTNVCFPPK
jgi:hypothetical protein